VTRKKTAIPDAAPDYGEPTFDDEMILCASHTGNTYQQDNRFIWTMSQAVFHGGPGWNWVSSFARLANGRGVAIRQHYLGEAFQSRICAAANKTLDGTFFDGHLRLKDTVKDSTMPLPTWKNQVRL
jgi:hypothetical protein